MRNIQKNNSTRCICLFLASFSLLTGLLLAACTAAASPAPGRATGQAVVLPSLTARPTASATPTPVPTKQTTKKPQVERTQKPTKTPTPTYPETWRTPSLTPTLLISTLAPAQEHHLQEWTVERAQQAIQSIAYFSENLGWRGMYDIYYYWTLHYAALAQGEAAARFPQAEMATQWRWERAYNLTQSDQGQALQVYHSLLEEALQSGEASLEEIPGWFAAHEQRLSLSLYPIPDRPNSMIVMVGEGFWGGTVPPSLPYGGSFVYWVIQRGKQFRIYDLESPYDLYYQNFREIRLEVLDLTGDGKAEVILGREWCDAGDCDTYLELYDLRQQPPRRLEIYPSVAGRYAGRYDDPSLVPWSALQEGGRNVGVRLTTTVENYHAPNDYLEWTYRWQRDHFELEGVKLLFENECQTPNLYCAYLAGQNLLGSIQSGGRQATAVIPELLNFYTEDEYAAEYLSVSDSDQARFQFGLALAALNEPEAARQVLEAVLERPAVPGGVWVGQTRKFLESYQPPDDFLEACIASHACALEQNFLRLSYLLPWIPASRLYEAPTLIEQAGFQIATSGRLDFDGDGTDEVWLIYEEAHKLTPPRSGPAYFTILYPDNQRLGMVSSDDIVYCSDSQIKFAYLTDYTGKRAYRCDCLLALVWRDPATGQFQASFSDYIELDHMINSLEAKILAREDLPETIRQLETIHTYMAPAVHSPWGQGFMSIEQTARAAYLAGLGYELSGNAEKAAAVYAQVCQEYPYSPYAILAYVKLEP